MMEIQIAEAILLSAGSGMSCAIATVTTLKTDINWIKKEMKRIDDAIVRAHERIDQIERQARN